MHQQFQVQDVPTVPKLSAELEKNLDDLAVALDPHGRLEKADRKTVLAKESDSVNGVEKVPPANPEDTTTNVQANPREENNEGSETKEEEEPKVEVKEEQVEGAPAADPEDMNVQAKEEANEGSEMKDLTNKGSHTNNEVAMPKTSPDFHKAVDDLAVALDPHGRLEKSSAKKKKDTADNVDKIPAADLEDTNNVQANPKEENNDGSETKKEEEPKVEMKEEQVEEAPAADPADMNVQAKEEYNEGSEMKDLTNEGSDTNNEVAMPKTSPDFHKAVDDLAVALDPHGRLEKASAKKKKKGTADNVDKIPAADPEETTNVQANPKEGNNEGSETKKEEEPMVEMKEEQVDEQAKEDNNEGSKINDVTNEGNELNKEEAMPKTSPEFHQVIDDLAGVLDPKKEEEPKVEIKEEHVDEVPAADPEDMSVHAKEENNDDTQRKKEEQPTVEKEEQEHVEEAPPVDPPKVEMKEQEPEVTKESTQTIKEAAMPKLSPALEKDLNDLAQMLDPHGRLLHKR